MVLSTHNVVPSFHDSGAAAVAGFFKTLDMMRPKGIRVVGKLACVRNSCGADAYVADEVCLTCVSTLTTTQIIRSRAGVRVRIGNTDAEGR